MGEVTARHLQDWSWELPSSALGRKACECESYRQGADCCSIITSSLSLRAKQSYELNCSMELGSRRPGREAAVKKAVNDRGWGCVCVMTLCPIGSTGKGPVCSRATDPVQAFYNPASKALPQPVVLFTLSMS